MKKILVGSLSLLISLSACTNNINTGTKDISSQNQSVNISNNIKGIVKFPENFSIKATSDIAVSATVSLINPSNNATVATALTNSKGEFSLFITSSTNFSPKLGDFYILEASKRIGNNLVSLRTIIKVGNTNWLSITGPAPVVINSETTAISVLQKIGLVTVDESISKLSVATDGSVTFKSISEKIGINAVKVLTKQVNDVLLTQKDPVELIKNPSILVFNNIFLDKKNISVNTSEEVKFNVSLNNNANLIPDSVKLQRVDENGNLLSELNTLLDDGSLLNADDIKGDNVFSIKQSFSEATVGQINLRISARTTDSEDAWLSQIFKINVITPLTTEDLAFIDNKQEEATTQLENTLTATKNIDTAIDNTVTWLNTQEGVTNAVKLDGFIKISYSSGVTGGIQILDSKELRGGLSYSSRKNKKQIPLSYQTVGELKPLNKNNFRINSELIDDTDPNTIKNKKVLIYAPFASEFAPYDESVQIQSIFENSDMGFSVVTKKDAQADVSTLMNMTDYGYIHFETHGAKGYYIKTGEIATQVKSKQYEQLLKNDWVSIIKNILFIDQTAPALEVLGTHYAITPEFIKSLPGKFPNSLIFNNSCESTKKDDLWNAFSQKGAGAYLGYSENVLSDFAVNRSVDFTTKFITELKNAGQSFTPGIINNNSSKKEEWQFRGNLNLYYSDSLINGDFETGDLTGWIKDGDGRVINKLGTLSPTQKNYMAIISTGLGYTTSSGSISQSFRVPANATNLSLKWNYLSEEFLEYINSGYQDYIRITIKDKESENIVYSNTIDGIANLFGATKSSPGSLISVSPDITFDRGGVYMTNWQNLDIPLSNYQGKIVNLTISAGDVGDSIYDTAVLIDEVTIK